VVKCVRGVCVYVHGMLRAWCVRAVQAQAKACCGSAWVRQGAQRAARVGQRQARYACVRAVWRAWEQRKLLGGVERV